MKKIKSFLLVLVLLFYTSINVYAEEQIQYIEDPGGGSYPGVKAGQTVTYTTFNYTNCDTYVSKTAYSEATAEVDLAQKKILIKADARPVWSSCWAAGNLGQVFRFDGTANKSAQLNFVGDYKVGLCSVVAPNVISECTAKITIDVEVWDITNNSRVGSRSILSELIGGAFYTIKNCNNSYNETLTVTLEPNHNYKAYIVAKAEATSRLTGQAIVDGNDDYQSTNYIKLNSFNIKVNN